MMQESGHGLHQLFCPTLGYGKAARLALGVALEELISELIKAL